MTVEGLLSGRIGGILRGETRLVQHFATRLLLALTIGLVSPGVAAAQPSAAPIPIGLVQGVVADSDRGTAHVSPLKDQTVSIRAVITELTEQRTSAGVWNHALFVQNTLVSADDDPRTSDGLFVFIGRSATLGSYRPVVGDELVLSGRVGEFFNMTQLESARVVDVVRSGVDLDTEVPTFEARPPDDAAEAARYWERHEGMRAHLAAGALVLGGRSVFGATQDSELWVARGDSTIGQRTDAYARRAFRDPHPLDDHPETLFDNGNGYRVLLGNSGLAAALGEGTLLAPGRTFDSVTNDLVGSVLYNFGKYRIEVTQQPNLAAGPDPSQKAPPADIERRQAYAVATFNLENLYDFRDDPNDGCDFTGNAGCPGVSPPFDYVPASEAAYQARLGGIAQQIVEALRSPDVLLVQEAEDQDICAVANGALVCGSDDNADGRPDVLQELALAIAAQGGPTYEAALDRDGADDRGIVAGFLYRTDRVQRVSPRADDPVLGATPRVSYRAAALAYNTDVQNPKALNAVLPTGINRSTGTDGPNVFTRAAQVGLFRIWSEQVGIGNAVDLYAISNHFSSGPDGRVGQRREQAAYNAAIADALLGSQADQRLVIGGDLNVFPRPDDPFAPGDALFPSDQLAALYQAGLQNLWDRVVEATPSAAYSYVFDGQAQTLDNLFVSQSLLDDLQQVQIAHINADWPADFPDDGPHGTSDHDPPRAVFALTAGAAPLPDPGAK
jgi:predicted extracellular nuclease